MWTYLTRTFIWIYNVQALIAYKMGYISLLTWLLSMYVNSLDPTEILEIPSQILGKSPVLTKYGSICFFRNNLFNIEYLLLQVIFILTNIELPAKRCKTRLRMLHTWYWSVIASPASQRSSIQQNNNNDNINFSKMAMSTHSVKKKKNHGLLQSNKYNDFVLSLRNNATTSRHQRRQCVGRRMIRDGVPSLESRAFYRWSTRMFLLGTDQTII